MCFLHAKSSTNSLSQSRDVSEPRLPKFSYQARKLAFSGEGQQKANSLQGD